VINLSLIKKYTIYFLITILIFFLFSILILYSNLVPVNDEIKKTIAEKEIDTVRKLIEYQLDKFQITVNDWSFWDDTFEFVKTGSQNYIDSNMTIDALVDLQIDYIVIFDSNKILKAYAAADELFENSKSFNSAIIQSFENIINNIDINNNGFINVENRLLTFASQKIYPSNKDGDFNGFLIMAKWFNTNTLEDLLKLSKRKIELNFFDENMMNESNLVKLSENSYLLKKQQNGFGIGYLIIEDVFTKNPWILEIRFPIEISGNLDKAINLFTVFTLILTLVSAIFLIYLLRKGIVIRLNNLIWHLNEITDKRQFDQVLTIQKNDEISTLSKTFNRLLSSLNKYQDFLKKIINLIPHKIYAKDINGKFILLNKETADYLNITVEEGLNKTLDELNPKMSKEFMDKIKQQDKEIIEEKKSFLNKEEIYSDDKKEFVIQKTSKSPLEDPFTGKTLAFGISVDITEMKKQQFLIEKQRSDIENSFKKSQESNSLLLRSESMLKKANQKLEASEKRLELALWGSQEEIWDWNLTNNIVTIFFPKESLDGINITDSKSYHWKDIIHPDDYNTLMKEFTEYIEKSDNDHFESEFRIKKGINHFYWCLCKGRITEKNNNGLPIRIIGTFKDITSRKNSEKELFTLAHFDALTKLPNRYSFMETLDKIIKNHFRSNLQFALFFLDLDGFKDINDTLGHLKGDFVLIEVASRLKSILKSSDIVFRLGGDEFTIVAENLTSEFHAAKIAERILKCFDKPFIIDDKEIFISTSIGVAVFPLDGDDKETLLKNADVAMYSVKTDGKNDFEFYSPSMNIHLHERINLESLLRKAIENNEMNIYYQPQIDTQKNRLVGLETLLRWNHPEYGYIEPLKFIPIAEETNMIIHIGNWLFKELEKQINKWFEEEFHPNSISINLSSKQFGDTHLLKTLEDFKKNIPDNSTSFTLEITEPLLMHIDDNLIQKISDIKKMGFQLAIDDFGTGYSSLNCMKKLPIDVLKIDCSFIKDMDKDKDSDIIIKTIIDLANHLNMEVIAEGVETEIQKDKLMDYGCNTVQGFYYMKAQPGNEIIRKLKDKNILF